MPLTQQQREILRSFVGYGVEHPKYVFIGPEEASEGLLLNLETRCTTYPGRYYDKNAACADLAQAYAAANYHKEAQRYRDAMLPGEEATWNFAAHLVAQLRTLEHGTPGLMDCFTEYRNLGTSHGDTLLAELFHLPKASTAAWPKAYRDEFGFNTQDAFYKDTWPRDTVPGVDNCPHASVVAAALAAIPLTTGRMVFAYGRGSRDTEFWHRFDLLLSPHTAWEDVIPSIAQIARHQTGAILARLGHPSPRSKNQIKIGHIPELVAAVARVLEA